mmetsp:Transcript_35584/g.70734  ORF Transcript_35584/g.70734 Transcript_35584/m.70734 type:complete len:189 (+) Transcript_35584:52-618(+)|eukprot:CAMPEP_0170401178 /NCGR_PEP_ID=MMETSP0117_2-20130122/24886_1 /TAXON_ID=400756 /ORGANISM="Durinskia baltica, Strain CSIRO CS-38" /LENGTH=188 /DNA_ID=CAMNT_0010657963 /DNA_START=40 /DNA_END=606 /DNA_ORIENTATION=-
MSAKVLNIVSVVFSICAFAFFIIGCIGYASTERTLRNTAWVTSDDHGFQLWANLEGLYVEDNGSNFRAHYSDCNNDTCDTCLMNGNAAFGLLLVATTFASFTIVLSGILISSPSAMVQLASTFTSFISGCFSLIGFALFMGTCYFKIEDEFPGKSIHYGPGSIITLLGLLMMWVTVFFQIGAVAMGGK